MIFSAESALFPVTVSVRSWRSAEQWLVCLVRANDDFRVGVNSGWRHAIHYRWNPSTGMRLVDSLWQSRLLATCR